MLIMVNKFSFNFIIILACAVFGSSETLSQEQVGLRGSPEAIADAQAMVEKMGGLAVWRELESLHFVHEWDIYNRPDRYLEHEILDMKGPRSYVTMKSEIYSRIRAYSPEFRYWNIVNGDFSYTTDEALSNALERAPYSIYRLAAAVARGDNDLEVRYGRIESVPNAQALEFADADGVAHGWLLLNVRREPVVWATTQYAYQLGPLKRFGNLLVPNWATTGNGIVRYEMVSLTGSNDPVDMSLFEPPADAANH